MIKPQLLYELLNKYFARNICKFNFKKQEECLVFIKTDAFYLSIILNASITFLRVHIETLTICTNYNYFFIYYYSHNNSLK